ncbi:MAG: solute:sodium symporter family transporter [Bacteroidia bacterium]|nr:solute:sodium symporter family transporter [Bacteroidia bacterium]
MFFQLLSFFLFTGMVAFFAWYQIRKSDTSSKDGYFLGGRSLSGIVIAGSLLLTNISTEHLIGMNGSAYENGAIIIAWEVTSAIALVIAAIYFVPRYLKMGITTIPEFLENRFDQQMRILIAFLLIISFVCTILPIVLYTGAINVESIFNLSETLGITQKQSLWLTVMVIGAIGSVYAIFGGLKTIALTDTINGFGLIILGLLIPAIALADIGEGKMIEGLVRVFENSPQKFNVISLEPSIGPGSRMAILPFAVLFTGLIINQLYFWTMHQSIIQRALGAASLKEAQKGLLFTGALKILVPLIVVLPGIIAYYYFGDSMLNQQDSVYPELVKKVLPEWMTGLFIAVIIGAIFSTFNSVLNSAATVFSFDIYDKIRKDRNQSDIVRTGKKCSVILAIGSMIIAPFVANAPSGLYQLLQQLNGIFFIPMATVILAGFVFKSVSAAGAKAGLFFGLAFYVILNYVIKVEMHFVHIWGLEFVLNLIVMHLVSLYYKPKKSFSIRDVGIVEVEPWRFTKPMSVILIVVTVLIYILLGNVG